MQHNEQGFTLIELMIVVAIIGVLAAVALPLYQDYSIKARVSEVVMATSQCRTAVSDFYQNRPLSSPPGINGWACESATGGPVTKYVQSVTTDANGHITVTSTGSTELGLAANKTIVLIPQRIDGTAKTWINADVGEPVGQFRCQPGGAAPMEIKFLPGSCN